MTLQNQEYVSTFSVSIFLEIGQIKLENYDIQELYFIEDIFSYSMSGKITFIDRDGILEFGPFTGNERIVIYYGDNLDKSHTFIMYKSAKITKNADSKDGEQTILELYFVDEMFYPLNFFKFSRSWKDTKIHDIITHVSEKILGVIKWGKVEKIKEKLDFFYTPYWTPQTTINWLLKRSTSVENKTAGYCFFNNSNGTNLITLEKMLKQKKLLTLSNEDDGKYIFHDTNLYLYNKILDWDISGIDISSMKSLAGSTILGYNTLEKKFIEDKNTYSNSLKKHTVLGKFSLFGDYSNTETFYSNEMENTSEKLNTIYNQNWIKDYTKQQILKIVVRGHSDRMCGELIEIDWPSSESVSNKYNKNLSGYYLIKSITHYFIGNNNPSYLQKMALIKNGYEDLDTTYILKSSKNNVAI